MSKTIVTSRVETVEVRSSDGKTRRVKLTIFQQNQTPIIAHMGVVVADQTPIAGAMYVTTVDQTPIIGTMTVTTSDKTPPEAQ